MSVTHHTLTAWGFALAMVALPLLCACSDDAPGMSGDTGGGEGGEGGHGGYGGGEPACGSDSPSSLRSCVESDRLQQDVTLIAQPRVPGSEHWQDVQDLCAERFEQYGFTVERHDYGTGINVVGKRAGESQPAEQVLLGAHYDHVAGCSGADDNASGVSAVLEVARVLSTATFSRTLVLACWDEEEKGLIGSAAYADRARTQGETFVVAMSLDPVGYASDEPDSQTMPGGFELLFPDLYQELEENEFRGDWIGIAAGSTAEPAAQILAVHADAVDLKRGLLVSDIAAVQSSLGSDQQSFWDEGYPALLLGNTGPYRNPYYHCSGGDDAPETLDYEFLTGVAKAATGGAAELLGLL